MADPACIPSLQIPSETDLLIRSLTTALALFSPNSTAKNKNKHHQSSRYDQFDRMSLFFVSGASGDAAAITALTEGNCVTFQTVQAQTDGDGRFAVPKNPEHSLSSNKNEDSEASGKLSPDAFDEPARHCLQWGPQSISPSTHGATLQRLLRSSYQEEQGDHIKAARLLHRYIYSFCIDKIFRRFNSKIPGFKPRYISLLLLPTDNITFEDYQAHSGKDIVLPQRLATRDESVLHKFLEARYPGHSFKLSDSPTKQLILDVEGQWTLWTFFKDYLKQAQDCLNAVCDTKSKQGRLKEEEIQTALQHLDELRLAMGIIFRLTHRSPNFWIVMGRMAPLLEARLGPQTHGNQIPSAGPTPHPGPGRDSAEHSPSSATDTGPDHHSSSPQSMATVDADTSEESDDDATSDAETTRHGRSARKTEHPEELHDTISKSWSQVTIVVRHWMKSITQWHHGLEDLNRGPKTLGILSKTLSIDVTVAPTSPLPTQQTSLIDTIKSTLPDSDAKELLGILRAKATLLCDNDATEPLLKTLADPDLADDAVSETWGSVFSGGIHCEAQLAHQILRKSPENHKCLIGISKRCCFCCAVLLRALNVNDGDIVEHGKIYSWSPPCEATEDKKKIVLERLKTKFRSYLEGCVPLRHRTPDSGSGNDSDGGEGLLPDHLLRDVVPREGLAR